MDDGGSAVAAPAPLTTIRTVAQTGSTNADMAALARTGLGEGVWLRAERQTAGRGRLGRSWISPPGNLYASTLVHLRATDPVPATLGLVAAVALDEAVRVYARDAPLALKWPNDLLLGGAKLSGILLERVEDAVVVGVGVNLAHHPDLPDRPTTSLADHGDAVTPGDLADTLAETFARWLATWRSGGVAPVRARWLDRAHPTGTALAARLPGGDVLAGLFAGLDADGALSLRLADGGTRVIHAADVFQV
ncbi:biotin--[acetyl-CoA-carboxylase] ligase [uncultured Sphingomonas sp.]|uniref:biotin--[acetyl-CoA-carboxylase] ligase n=1 Tax=uncultured Sphingomonas sp. TaxID=158754 RepID=UPI0035CB48DE